MAQALTAETEDICFCASVFPGVLPCLLFLSASNELVKLLSNSRNSANKQQLHYCFQINVYLNDLVKDKIEVIK